MSNDRFEIEVKVHNVENQPVIKKVITQLVIEYYLGSLFGGISRNGNREYKADRGIPFGVNQDDVLKYASKIGN
jgi:hypothetical protein